MWFSEKMDLNLKNIDTNFPGMCLDYQKVFYDVISAFLTVFYKDFYRLLSIEVILGYYYFLIGPVKCYL